MMISAPLTKSPYWASPQDERLRGDHHVAVLEAEAGVLAQRRIVELEAGEGAGQMLERHVSLAGLGIPEAGVPLAEGAADRVLAREPDRRSLAQKSGEGEQLRVPQSMRGSSPSSAAARRSSCFISFGCTENPPGRRRALR